MDQYHESVEPILKEFFSRENGRVFQKRLRLEWRRAEAVSERKAEAGRRGGLKPKLLKTKDIA